MTGIVDFKGGEKLDGRDGAAAAPPAPPHPRSLLQTIRTESSGSRSMWISMRSPRTTGPTFSGVPE